MDAIPVLDISSDDEVGLHDCPTADNFDWISKLFNDDSDEFNGEGVDNCDDDNDSDDVVVVNEVVSKPKRGKLTVPRCVKDDDDDDDDCVMLDCDPGKSTPAKEKHSDEDSNDLVIVGEKGQVACRDYPHPRHLCAKFPFGTTLHESYCDLCHCYVCDSVAPCGSWGSGLSTTDHCHATDKIEHWQSERKRVRQSKNAPMQVTKQLTAGLVRRSFVHAHPRSQPTSTRAHPVPRLTSTCRAPPPFGLPNIISQGRSQRASLAATMNRFQSQFVSRQLSKACNTSTTNAPSNRGPNLGSTLAASRPMFKRSGLTARPVNMSYPSVYSAPNNVTMSYLTSQQLGGGKPNENNGVTLTEPSLPSDLLTSGLCFQFPGYSQPNVGHVLGSHVQVSGTPTAVTSDSPYVYTSINQQPESVYSPSVISNSSGALSTGMRSNEQPSSVQVDVSDSLPGDTTVNVPNCITSLNSPSLQLQGTTMHQPTTIPSNNFSTSGEQTSADSLQVPGVLDEQIFGSTNSSNIDYDIINNWLSETEDFKGTEEVGSYLCDMNNQPSIASPVDTGMLYFDFETSWKGLSHP